MSNRAFRGIGKGAPWGSASEPLQETPVRKVVSVSFARKVHCLLGLPFDAVDMGATVARLRAAAGGGASCFLSTPNLNFLITAQDDAAFRASVINSDLSIADGMPLIWIGRLLGLPLGERVAGANLFEALRRDTEQPLLVYFFGAPPGVAAEASLRLNAEARGLRCVGFECPGFGSVEEMSSAASIDRINASGADFVVVALGARKGQEWIERNRSRLAAPVVSHLGAVVGFVAGTVSRAPPWMQNNGMEWLWRIKEEPHLWRRYFSDGLILLRLLATRVLPLALHLRLRRPLAKDFAAATIMASTLPNGDSALRLQGAWTDANLEPLRQAFAILATDSGSVRLDLVQVSHLDSAAIGLIMVLHGHLAQRGRCCTIDSASDAARRILELSCAAFLLSPLARRRAARAGASPGPVAAAIQGASEMFSGPVRFKPGAVAALPALSGSRTHGLGWGLGVKRSAVVLAAVMCAASIGAIAVQSGTQQVASPNPAVKLDTMVPTRFAGWREEPQRAARVVNPQAKDLLDKLYSQILTRTYVNADGYRVMLSIAYGHDQRGGLQAHKPEVCYPAQGFTLQSLTTAVLGTAFGSIPATRLFASIGERKEPVTYWFTVGDSAISSSLEKRIVEFRYRLTGQIPDGLLFRVSSIDGDPARAYEFQNQFVSNLLESVPPADRVRLSGLSKLASNGSPAIQ